MDWDDYYWDDDYWDNDGHSDVYSDDSCYGSLNFEGEEEDNGERVGDEELETVVAWGEGEEEEEEEEEDEDSDEHGGDEEADIPAAIAPPPPPPVCLAPFQAINPPVFAATPFLSQIDLGGRGGQRQRGRAGADLTMDRAGSSGEGVVGVVDLEVAQPQQQVGKIGGENGGGGGGTWSESFAGMDSSESGIRGVPICPICFDRWTSQGEHCLCCLPCGHLYGLSCINKWLRRPNALTVCPQCNKACKLEDVRKLYGASVALAVDEELLQKVKYLEAKCASLELKDAEWARKEAEWYQKEANLHEQLNQQKRCS